MATVRYNGVTLPYAMHSSFNQEAVPDESGTDWTLMKFDISVSCVVGVDYIRLLLPDLEGASNPDSAAAIMNLVRVRLLQRRKTLSVVVNGVELIPARMNNQPGTVDAKNGPIPQSCLVTELSSETFMVSFHIIAHYWQNLREGVTQDLVLRNTNGGAVISNRWTEMVDMDDCMKSTKTRNGTFTIRSDNRQGLIADLLRAQMAVVGIPDGYLRKSSRYEISADGLSVKYSITDEEYFKPPPAGVYRAQGTFTMTTSKLGVFTYAECRVKLTGTQSNSLTPQNRLVQLAVGMAAQKVYIAGAKTLAEDKQKGKGFSMLESANVAVEMWENSVTVSIRAMVQKGKKRIDGVSFAPDAYLKNAAVTKVPGCEGPRPRPTYYDRGTAGIILQAAAYYDPSLENTQLAGGTGYAISPLAEVTSKTNAQMNRGQVPGAAGREGENV